MLSDRLTSVRYGPTIRLPSAIAGLPSSLLDHDEGHVVLQGLVPDEVVQVPHHAVPDAVRPEGPRRAQDLDRPVNPVLFPALVARLRDAAGVRHHDVPRGKPQLQGPDPVGDVRQHPEVEAQALSLVAFHLSASQATRVYFS